MYTGSLEAASNKEDWIGTGSLIDEDNAEVTLTGATFEMFICKPNDPNNAILTASTANGKFTLPSATTFQWAFTPDDMDDLCAGTYDVFMRVTIAGVVTQIMSCTVPIKEGGPT